VPRPGSLSPQGLATPSTLSRSVATGSLAQDSARTPLALYGELFVDVQMSRVFADGKTFVDATPRRLAPAEICDLYRRERRDPAFSLRDFVLRHFKIPSPEVQTGPNTGIREHICALWPLLLRRSAPSQAPAGTDTLLPLPHPYVVPGGRFRELYYWDSYFTMLGLMADGCSKMAEDMLRNFASLIDRYGFIPNSSRSYMLSRSQPPLFFKMVESVAGGDAALAFARYLPQLKAEHAYWMSGEGDLAPNAAHLHVVRLADGSLLNRYWDEIDEPREESYRQDVLTARAAGDRPAAEIYRDLRAAAESGWDFSSRWCADPDRIETIETTSIVPIDLNALLWGLENAIAQGCGQAGDAAGAAAYTARAARRRATIDRALWSPALGHYVDFHWRGNTPRHQLTAAALVPLYTGVASQDQADATARVASGGLLARNGLQTTLRRTGQQWDAPNGWAPLQWMGSLGLHRYGHTELAREIASRWVASVHRVYLETGRLLEKYDVMEDQPGGGGEYETQDGFGWTNGSFVALQDGLLRSAMASQHHELRGV
jgi:alpha,alpha-trehalase